MKVHQEEVAAWHLAASEGSKQAHAQIVAKGKAKKHAPDIDIDVEDAIAGIEWQPEPEDEPPE